MARQAKNASVVVLGGGFGGLFSTYHLTAGSGRDPRLPVTLINRDEEFVFKPLLPEAVGGSARPHFLTNNLPQLADNWNFSFVQGEVEGIDLEAKRVVTTAGEFPYRDLVISLGCVVNDHGLDLNGPSIFYLHELDDGPRLRAHVQQQVKKAITAKSARSRKAALSFVSVGAGPTGIETMTEVQEYVGACLQEAQANDMADLATYTIVEAGVEILPTMNVRIRQDVSAILKRRGIDVITHQPVATVSKKGCTLANGDVLAAGTIVWAAGTRANPLMHDLRAPMDPRGRVRVDNYLRPRGHANVFALGDNACALDRKSRAPLPATGQVAVQQAKTVAQNIRRRGKRKALQAFKYTELGQLVPMGGGEAAGEVLGRRVEGTSGWLASRAAYISRVMGMDNRLGLAWGWGRQAMAQSLLRPLWR